MHYSPIRGFAHVTSPTLREFLEGSIDAEGDDMADILSISRSAIVAQHSASTDHQQQRLFLNQLGAYEYNEGRQDRARYHLQLAHDLDLDPRAIHLP